MKKNIKLFSKVLPHIRESRLTVKTLWFRTSCIFFVGIILSLLIMLSKSSFYHTVRDFFTPSSILSLFILSLFMMLIIGIVFSTTKGSKGLYCSRNKLLVIICTSLVLTFLLSFGFSRLINTSIVPLLLASLLITTLVDYKTGIVTHFFVTAAYYVFTVLVFKDTSALLDSLSSLISITIAGIIMILFSYKVFTRLRFTMIGFFVAIGCYPVAVLMHVVAGVRDVYTVFLSGVWSFAGILLSVSLYMLVLPVLEYIFRASTMFRMSELCSLDTPLLKRLVKEAPGTFNHSLVVSNLAEICADAIGENTQVAKAAAYYHDVGKVLNPEYFVENQSGYNPHEDIIPEVSVSMIISHVTEGFKMIKEARLPDILADVAIQHHGTTSVNYFFYKAQGYTEDGLNRTDFLYPGPRPRTKIAAIIMIADTCEAATRAMGHFEDSYEYRKFIHRLIKDKMDANQFAECDISFSDLQIIEDVLVSALPSMSHTRIKYDNAPKRVTQQGNKDEVKKEDTTSDDSKESEPKEQNTSEENQNKTDGAI